MQADLRVFGLRRFVLFGLVPSKIFNAVRSSGDICLNVGFNGFFIGDVKHFMFSFSMSSLIFSFFRRRSSSFQIRRARVGLLSVATTNIINTNIMIKMRIQIEIGEYLHHADSHSIRTMNNVSHFFHHPTPIQILILSMEQLSMTFLLQHSMSFVSSMFFVICHWYNSYLTSYCSPNGTEMVLILFGLDVFVVVAFVVVAAYLRHLHHPRRWHRHEPDYILKMHFRMMIHLELQFLCSALKLYNTIQTNIIMISVLLNSCISHYLVLHWKQEF